MGSSTRQFFISKIKRDIGVSKYPQRAALSVVIHYLLIASFFCTKTQATQTYSYRLYACIEVELCFFCLPPVWGLWMWSSWGVSAKWSTSSPSLPKQTHSPWRRGTTLNRRWEECVRYLWMCVFRWKRCCYMCVCACVWTVFHMWPNLIHTFGYILLPSHLQ